jgi:hypothetical protein
MTSPPKVVSIEELRELRRRRETEGNPAPKAPRSEGEADERARLMTELREALDDLPDVRMDKVIEARQRIATGYYDKDRVRLDILTALIDEESGHDPGLTPKTRPAPPAEPGAQTSAETGAQTSAEPAAEGKSKPRRERKNPRA